jgi:hypothetical protein
MTALILAIATSLGGLVSQDPSTRASSVRYTVDTLSRGGDDRPARVMISNLRTSRRHIISVNSTLGALRRAIIRDDEERVLLLCAKGFVVVDPDGQVPADEVYAREPVASAGGRWIAYQRFYPPTHPGTTEGVALYDTQRSREDNHAAYPVADEREWRAGWPIYPPATEWRSAGLVTSSEEAHVLTSLLMWMGPPEAPALVLTMRKGDTDTLVFATPGADPSAEPLRVCAEPLPGPAERWGTRTVTMRPAPQGGQEVRVESGALGDDPPTATFTFGPECTRR